MNFSKFMELQASLQSDFRTFLSSQIFQCVLHLRFSEWDWVCFHPSKSCVEFLFCELSFHTPGLIFSVVFLPYWFVGPLYILCSQTRVKCHSFKHPVLLILIGWNEQNLLMCLHLHHPVSCLPTVTVFGFCPQWVGQYLVSFQAPTFRHRTWPRVGLCK